MALKKILDSCSRNLSKLKYGASSNPSPPYEFMCQVGDPVLRVRAEPVDPKKVTGAEVQKVTFKNSEPIVSSTLCVLSLMEHLSAISNLLVAHRNSLKPSFKSNTNILP